jgi:hypothetical protein
VLRLHLDRVHSVPVHCPNCYVVFRNNIEGRDRHVREGTCQTVSECYLEGIDEATMRNLKRRVTGGREVVLDIHTSVPRIEEARVTL